MGARMRLGIDNKSKSKRKRKNRDYAYVHEKVRGGRMGPILGPP